MKKVLDFLKENSVMALATSLSDKPRSSTMEYYMVGDAIIFATSRESIKAANLNHNKRISISVYNNPKFVTVDGFVTAPATEEIEAYNEELFRRHTEFKEYAEKEMESFVYFKVVIETAYYSDFSTGMPPEVINA